MLEAKVTRLVLESAEAMEKGESIAHLEALVPLLEEGLENAKIKLRTTLDGAA